MFVMSPNFKKKIQKNNFLSQIIFEKYLRRVAWIEKGLWVSKLHPRLKKDSRVIAKFP